MLLDLIQKLGYVPKRQSNTNQGEYASPCPFENAGDDRFRMWPATGRYWCRSCGTRGHYSWLLHKFCGVPYDQAKGIEQGYIEMTPMKREVSHDITSPPSLQWQETAMKFVEHCHKTLMEHQEALSYLLGRGFTLETLQRFQVGLNEKDRNGSSRKWGTEKDLFIGQGIVIPSFQGEPLPQKIKIRSYNSPSLEREEVKEIYSLIVQKMQIIESYKNKNSRFYEISGSRKQFSVYGDRSLPLFVVEAEIDAMLIQQVASDLVCSVALGGVSKKPDQELHLLLMARKIVLSLDNDPAGIEKVARWKEWYPKLRSWMLLNYKSPSEAIEAKEDLYEWIEFSINQ